ncbi:hypothetical protein ON010_g2993 [Phytophthora cinnamomi]|nr:hypothetical protein ON010_g2993 [Phytophthora cinnamomi]
MGRTGAKVKKGGLGNALLRTQKKHAHQHEGRGVQRRQARVRARRRRRVGGAGLVPGRLVAVAVAVVPLQDDFLASAVLANREFTAVKESIMLMEEADAGPQLIECVQDGGAKLQTNGWWSHCCCGCVCVYCLVLQAREAPGAGDDVRRDEGAPPPPVDRVHDGRGAQSVGEGELPRVASRHCHAGGVVRAFGGDPVREELGGVASVVARPSTDLDVYAKEGETPRRTLLIVNKSDFLSEGQRTAWGEHFKAENIDYVFFSAKEAQDEIDEEAKKLRQEARNAGSHDEYDEAKPADAPQQVVDDSTSTKVEISPYPVLSRIELLEYVTKIASEVLQEVGVRAKDKGLIKFGMVGFPNVGKSSVINALLGASTYSHKTQRVAVGATPGKTKHFQTMILSDKIMLCDCPGLVFPSFVNSKAEMYCCGVLPLSQLRDHISPCQLLCHRIPKRVFERTYGIKIQTSKTAKETDPVEIYALLESYARNRGYTTTGKGGPDTSRAARDILRHYVNGRLLYCHPPPNVSDPNIFDIHVLAKAQFPDVEEPVVPESVEDEGANDEANPATDANAEDVLEFDTTVEDKQVVSKRLKKHGRKGRKGRDKNPYEDSDLPGGFAGVHINSGGKKKNRRPYERSTLIHA